MAVKDEYWIASSDVLSLFPTFVWNIQLGRRYLEATSAKILAALGKLRQGLPPLLPGKAWQSGHQLHELEEFSDMVAYVNDATKSVLRFLNIAYDSFETTGCRTNANAGGPLHAAHAHPDNFPSGVCCLQVQAGANAINFHDPRSHAAIIRQPVTELSSRNTDPLVVGVKKGTLLFSLSYLHHSVAMNDSKQERISISFNLAFSSLTENLSKPLS